MSENRGTGLHRRAQCGDQGARARLRGDRSLLSRHPGAHHRVRRGRDQGVRVRPDPAVDRPHAASGPGRDVAGAGRARTRQAAAAISRAPGVVRCDEVEKLPPDLDGFWILNPAGIVHLVCSPEAEEAEATADAAARADGQSAALRHCSARTGRTARPWRSRPRKLRARRRTAPARRQLLVVDLGGVAAGATDEEVGLRAAGPADGQPT